MGDMVTKIYLVRHGETEAPHPKRYKGHIDVPLSENGIRQLKELSGYLVKECSASPSEGSKALKAVYCSDLERARKSAEIIAQPFGLEPVVLEELRERSFGQWEGMTFDEIKQKWPDAFRDWAADPLRHRPPGGESTMAVRDRAMAGMTRIMEEVQGRCKEESCANIAVVAHGGINRILLCEWLGMPLENIFRIEQDFGCLNVIEMHDGFPVVKHVNLKLDKES
jgi:alpha-ribazole phosphatase